MTEQETKHERREASLRVLAEKRQQIPILVDAFVTEMDEYTAGWWYDNPEDALFGLEEYVEGLYAWIFNTPENPEPSPPEFQIDRPRFADIPVGSLFTRPDQGGSFMLLKTHALYYVWDFDIIRAHHGHVDGHDTYYIDEARGRNLRVELIGHVDDRELVARILDEQLMDETLIECAYGPDPRYPERCPCGAINTPGGHVCWS